MSTRKPTGGALQRLFDSAPELVCVLDADGVFRLVSPSSRALLGIEAEQLVGTPVTSLVVEADRERADLLFTTLGPSRPSASFVLRIPVEGRGVRRVRWSVTADSETADRYVVAWDVTVKQQTQARYRAAMEASPTALIMVDDEGRIVLANLAAEHLLGVRKQALLGRRVETFVPEEARIRHTDLGRLFTLDSSAGPVDSGRDLSVRRADGEILSVEIGLSPTVLDGRLYVVVSLVDVTERKRARERIEELAGELKRANESLEILAVTDELTGLWNRRKFMEEADRFIKLMQQTGGPFSLILMDLDDFKGVNDRFGHLAGDAVLRRVADHLREVRHGSDFVARYGGEEFVVGLPATGAQGAEQLAERLRFAVEGLRWEGPPVTASLGVATLRDLGERGTPTSVVVSRLIAAADAALYESKNAGKNQVTYRAVAAESVRR